MAIKIERLEHREIEELKAENERLRAENIKVSCHCAALIQELKDSGATDERLKQIANEQLTK